MISVFDGDDNNILRSNNNQTAVPIIFTQKIVHKKTYVVYPSCQNFDIELT